MIFVFQVTNHYINVIDWVIKMVCFFQFFSSAFSISLCDSLDRAKSAGGYNFGST